MDAIAQSLVGAARRHRRLWLALAALIFVAGCVASVRQLDFEAADLRLLPTALILLVLAPLSLLYGAVGLLILCRGSGVVLSFSQAFRANSAAQLAEILPIPGGAIVRAGALVAAGAGVGKSAALVTLGAILWVLVALAFAGLALALLFGPHLVWIGLAATVGVAVTLVLLARLVGWRLSAVLLLHRMLGCLLMAARMSLAFAAIGAGVPILVAFIFGLAMIGGSAAAIAPAGLGLSELLGAAMGEMIGVDPFAAFLAIALNRLLGLVATGFFFALSERAQARAGTANG